jgi:hypothetical protein
VTLTLPESTLARLARVHEDISHAIVRLAESEPEARPRAPAELAMYGRRAVISIRPVAALERRVGIDLIPLPDGRALISFDQPQTIADLELMLSDALDDRGFTVEERRVFESIRNILKDARRSSDVRLLRRSIIVLEYTGPARDAGAANVPAKKEPR